jgi:hypothetical protein
VTNPALRASDEDRHRVVQALERHTAAGRLTVDEFSDRAGRAYAAATRTELALVLHDLPPESIRDTVAPVPLERRALLLALAIATVTIVALGLALALAR